ASSCGMNTEGSEQREQSGRTERAARNSDVPDGTHPISQQRPQRLRDRMCVYALTPCVCAIRESPRWVVYISLWMADDGTSLVKRLRDGLRLVSTVVQAFAESTTDYHRLLDTIARHVAEAIPDTCIGLLRSGDSLTVVALHNASPALCA